MTPDKRAWRKQRRQENKDYTLKMLKIRLCIDCSRTSTKFVRDNEVRPPSYFYRNRWCLDRLSREIKWPDWQGLCEYCLRKRRGQTSTLSQRLYRRKIRDFTHQLKQQSDGCLVCGEQEPVALDFHHSDPSTKKGEVRRMNSLRLVEEEAAKCVIICANCHRKFHSGLISLPDVN